ncbi:hypothetical protein ISCGN_012743 [Ixodes scapularis]
MPAITPAAEFSLGSPRHDGRALSGGALCGPLTFVQSYISPGCAALPCHPPAPRDRHLLPGAGQRHYHKTRALRRGEGGGRRRSADREFIKASPELVSPAVHTIESASQISGEGCTHSQEDVGASVGLPARRSEDAPSLPSTNWKNWSDRGEGETVGVALQEENREHSKKRNTHAKRKRRVQERGGSVRCYRAAAAAAAAASSICSSCPPGFAGEAAAGTVLSPYEAVFFVSRNLGQFVASLVRGLLWGRCFLAVEEERCEEDPCAA